MTLDLTAGIVRILNANKQTVGTGFVVTNDGLIVTCAHVINAALGRPQDAPDYPGEPLSLIFHHPGSQAIATVEPDGWQAPEAEDIALLHLNQPLPATVKPLPLWPATESAGHRFRAFGFPAIGDMQGVWAGGEIKGLVRDEKGRAWLQLASPELTHGVSGGPIWDETRQRVVGMLSSTYLPDITTKHRDTAFALPVEVLRDSRPDLPLTPPVRTPPTPASSSSVTIGDVSGGIHGSTIAGRDVVNISIQLIQQAGLAEPRSQDLAALRDALQQALPQLDPTRQAQTRAAIDKLEEQLQNLPRSEQAYWQRVRDRYDEEAGYFVELAGETTEAESLSRTSRSIRRRRQRTQADYCEWLVAGQEIRRVRLNSLREGVDKYPCIILLGDPGSGKTTALEHLAYEVATENLSSGAERGFLPLPLRLSEFGPGQTIETFISRVWAGSSQAGGWQTPELAANLAGYLEQGRLFILFDALNEMPRDGYAGRAGELRRFIDRWHAKGNRFLVTCRVLDYGEELAGLQRVEVQPLNDEQIQEFVQKELPQNWPALWQALTGDEDKAGKRDQEFDRDQKSDRSQKSDRGQKSDIDRRKLLALARNPYLLTVMIDVYNEDGALSANRAALMARFTQILFNWAKTKPHLAGQWLDAAIQRAALSQGAFEMQQARGSGAVVETLLVKTVLPDKVRLDPAFPPVPVPPEQVLTLAAGANIIEMPVNRSTVRFYHQLLQEYFSARELLRRLPPSSSLQTGEDMNVLPPLGGIEGELTTLWHWPWLEKDMPPVGERGGFDPLPPPPPTGWEETTILAAGLAPENDNQLVRALLAINPVLAGRCLHEGQAKVDAAIRTKVIDALLNTIAQPEVALRVRIAAGEVLGELGDPRLGESVTIPGGEFVMGDDKGEYDDEKPQHKLFLPDYEIGRFPVTNAEYGRFIEAGGYRQKRWWTAASWQQKEKEGWAEPADWDDRRFNRPNQPVVGVSWYECVAYCHWWSVETGRLYRLPTEAEWEKAARGTDGRTFPWGNDFDPARVNMKLGEQQVNATTPVGIYPTGVSPYGLFDCAGNVDEWCATRGQGDDWSTAKLDPYPYQIRDEWAEEYLAGTNVRVLRGGSWFLYFEGYARCASRLRVIPFDRFNYWGCRLLVSPI